MATRVIFRNIADEILSEVNKAQISIFIAVAWVTDSRLFDALIAKAKSGCHVILILANDEFNHGSNIDFLKLKVDNSDVCFVDSLHHKFCIIDQDIIITGSYNWSYRAKKNHENILINQGDKFLVQQFLAEFNKMRLLSSGSDQTWGSTKPEEKKIVSFIFEGTDLFNSIVNRSVVSIAREGHYLNLIKRTVKIPFSKTTPEKTNAWFEFSGKFQGFMQTSGGYQLTKRYLIVNNFYCPVSDAMEHLSTTQLAVKMGLAANPEGKYICSVAFRNYYSSLKKKNFIEAYMVGELSSNI